ncbi:hypothetical protein EV294_102458 [Paenibacillus sp. BK033]|nr:hypothetical protein EV294_102458 [Paenibacillus sp. BK033]
MILETRLCTRIPPIVNLFKESEYLFPHFNLLRRRGFAGVIFRNDVEGTGR